MNRSILLLILFAGPLRMAGQSPPVPGEWEITFQDDFDLDHIDPAKWRQGQNVSHINGAASNDGHNIVTGDGTVKLIADKKSGVFSGKPYDYASGELTTFDLFRQVYGYIEVRAKYDAVQGSWPAVWIMPDQGIRGSEGLKRQAFIKFNFDSIPRPVDSATLHIKVKSLSSENCGFSIHRLLSDAWTESTLNWNNKPECDPVWVQEFTGTTDPGRIDQIDPGMFISVAVTGEINRSLADGIDPGFVLKDYFLKQAEVQFYSREALEEGDRPYLEIDGVKIYPSDDATVRGGPYAGMNYGSRDNISTLDPWAGTSSTYNGGMEMDILETLGVWGADHNQHALHWDGYGDDHQSAGSGKITLSPTGDGFHTYGLYWQPGKVEFYTDGTKTWEHASERIGSVPAYILLSHQMGGWDGNGTIIDDDLPATVTIDYVRVYKNTRGAFLEIGEPVNGSVWGTSSAIPVNASVTEWGGIVASVEFYAGDSLLARDTVSPYSMNITGLSRGEYTITARALDPGGDLLQADSTRITISEPPVVSVLFPDDSSLFVVPLDLTIEAEVASEGTITRVEFLIDGAPVSVLDAGPYSFVWMDVQPGNYDLRVRATDDLGLVTESESLHFTVRGQGIPDPWVMVDIGAPDLKGSGSFYNGSFLLEGSGKDVWGNADKMNFIYQGLDGDGEIIARIEEISSDYPFAKAGVMMRENVTPGSVTAGVFVTKEHGGEFFRRSSPDGSAKAFSFNPVLEAPVWIKLAREEGLVRGFTSQDGSNWSRIEDFELQTELEATIVTGMGITSLSNDKTAECRMDHVKVNGAAYMDQIPILSIVSPAGDTLISNGITIGVQASDPDGGKIKWVEFFANDESIGSISTLPYTLLWEDVPEGSFTVSAECLDDEGNISRSDPLVITSLPVSVGRPSPGNVSRMVIRPSTSNGCFLLSFSQMPHFTGGEIGIYEICGRLVHTQKIRDPVTLLELQSLGSGIFCIRFTGGSMTLTEKVVISL